MKVNWENFFSDGRFSEYVVENIIRAFVEDDDVFLDGGANEGRHTLVGLAAGAAVVAVEPIPDNYFIVNAAQKIYIGHAFRVKNRLIWSDE